MGLSVGFSSPETLNMNQTHFRLAFQTDKNQSYLFELARWRAFHLKIGRPVFLFLIKPPHIVFQQCSAGQCA